MKASEIMTTGVISVGPSTSIQDIARTLLSNHISAVPVVDELGNVVGVVSEADLIHPVESLQSRNAAAADVMTKPAVVAGPDASLDEIVALLDAHRIKRVPIVENGKLTGIVTRSNILLALAISHSALEKFETAST